MTNFTDIRDFLRAHCARYPELALQDGFKALYQAQAVLQNAEVHTAVVAAEQLDELGDTVTASRRFGADVVCGGGRVGDQMLAAQ